MAESGFIRKEIQRYFAGKPSVIAVYLFGSAARGGMGPQSDVDVAVLSEPVFDNTATSTSL